MKILYAIQGTGNGHVCRAYEIVPLLKERAEVDVLISGIQSDLQLPFPVKYVFNGLSFIFGRRGGVDLLETYKKSRVRKLLREVSSLPIAEYDLVISDFEPVSAWACAIQNKPCIALSHQSAVLDKRSPKPKKIDPVGKTILKVYAPASVHYGFHFTPQGNNIYSPVIRSEIRNATVSDKGHYTVYLPAYSDKKIIKMLSQFQDVKWEVFSKHFDQPVECSNILLSPINNKHFIESMASATGVLCGAGFETPAEALFLRKKLMVIPMKNQYEQHCNAAALKELGVAVLQNFKTKRLPQISDWLASDHRIILEFPDHTAQIIDHILEAHGQASTINDGQTSQPVGVRQFRAFTLRRILHKLSN